MIYGFSINNKMQKNYINLLFINNYFVENIIIRYKSDINFIISDINDIFVFTNDIITYHTLS